MFFRQPTPILRSFDEAKALEFYSDFLGFAVDWRHRFADDLPLYMQVSRDACVLHISEHHGDATPGSALRIEVGDVAALHADLSAKAYRNARPGLEQTPWQTTEFSVQDPFGNRLTFFTHAASTDGAVSAPATTPAGL
jgi:uncharacterized glyoxalase superfamily protein PhnB